MKSHIKNLDAFQIVGFVISAFISIILYILGQDTISSITLGLLLAVVTQLFDIQKRINDSEERIQQANKLSEVLYRDRWLFEQISQITADYQLVNKSGFNFFKNRAKEAIFECTNIIHSMAEGYFADPRGTIYGDQAVRQARKSLKNVATEGISYWQSIHAESQIEANADAVQRGVTVTRIFVQSQATLQKMTDILEKQSKKGIDIYIAFTDNSPSTIIEDYLIVDDRVVAILKFRSDGIGNEQTISVDPIKVEQMVKKFDWTLQYARPLEEVMMHLKKAGSSDLEGFQDNT